MDLPKSLNEIIGPAIWERNEVGMSEASVYKLNGINNGGIAYLKMAKRPLIEPLYDEAQILRWLNGKLQVPNVLLYEDSGDHEYLLLSEIEGENVKDVKQNIDPIELGMCLAKGLNAIHQIDTSHCPYNAQLHAKFQKATEFINAGMVDPNEFEPQYRGKTPEQLLTFLKNHQPENEDLVFTHGDYSLANIMIMDNRLTGVIDWGRAGIADRHQDLAIAIRSLRHNVSEIAVEAFMDAYGKEHLEIEKVDYYIMLDELF